MRNWLKPILITLRNIAIPAIIYSAIIFLMVYFLPSIKKPWYEAFKFMNSPAFYIGIAFVIIFIILQKILPPKMKNEISRYILLGVTIIIISLGISVIMLSYNKPLWENLSYNLTAFGVGVSMTALGLAFLFAFYPRSNKECEKLVKELNRNTKALHNKITKIEKTVSKLQPAKTRGKKQRK